MLAKVLFYYRYLLVWLISFLFCVLCVCLCVLKFTHTHTHSTIIMSFCTCSWIAFLPVFYKFAVSVNWPKFDSIYVWIWSLLLLLLTGITSMGLLQLYMSPGRRSGSNLPSSIFNLSYTSICCILFFLNVTKWTCFTNLICVSWFCCWFI